MSTLSNTVSSASNSAAGSGYAEVDPRTAHGWFKAGSCVIVDVREPDEHAREHIKGAQLNPMSRFNPSEIRFKPGQSVVFQCRSGRRSADVLRLVASNPPAGAQLFNLTGGINAWKQSNLPVRENTKVSGISVMRQVQLIIGLCVLLGSALAWFIHPAFVAIPAFFGAGLTFAGATGTCALAAIVAKLPWNRSAAGCSGGSCSA